jgi:NAD(P)-dependent dehydrogenase (short-subunit alcohol dehydrogenase family)
MGSGDQSRVWLVTGASGGLGQAICRAALDIGDRVVATGRDRESLDSFGAADDRLLIRSLDVTDPAASHRVVDDAVAAFGRIDVVVNNAGYGHFGAVEELSDADIRRQFDVNFFGLATVTRAALPHLRRQGSGVLVQMSSLNGVIGMAGGAYYCASKFAVEGFSESLAQEVGPLGIQVMLVEPGPHRTHFAGSGARLAEPMPDYAATVGVAREAFASMDGTQPGDPHRAAAAIVDAVKSGEPPMRLTLGRMAIDAVRDKLEDQVSGLKSWGTATEFE